MIRLVGVCVKSHILLGDNILRTEVDVKMSLYSVRSIHVYTTQVITQTSGALSPGKTANPS